MIGGSPPRWLAPSLEDGAEHLDAAAVLRVAAHLAGAGSRSLAAIDDAGLERAFLGAVDAFRQPASPERRRLDPHLLGATELSQPCLDESLAALLDGFSVVEVRAVIARARVGRHATAAVEPGGGATQPHLLVLAANLPGLVLQPLLASLAVRRPALLKSSSREPFFAPAFAAALAAREPRLGEALAALTWSGGERGIEARLAAAVDRVVAYGGAEALAGLRASVGDQLIAFGPKVSVAMVGADVLRSRLEEVAAGLARDAALFEQRGCLSLQAIYTDGDADSLADAMADALLRAADRWPPPRLSTPGAAAVRLAREEARFLGMRVAATPLERATVIVDRRPALVASPGRRTVRIHPVSELGSAIDALRPAAGLLQGAALAGRDAESLRDALRGLGVSFLCGPGRLQSPGASWSNGGVDLVTVLGAAGASSRT